MNQPKQTPISPEVVAVQVVDSRSLLSAMLDHYCQTMAGVTGKTADQVREEVFQLANEYKPHVVEMMVGQSLQGQGGNRGINGN